MPKKQPPPITSAIDMLERIMKEDIITLKFRKRTNNEERIMRCTLNFERVPKSDKPKSVNLKKILKLIQDHRILHVYDIEKKGWRSVPLDATEWFEAKQQRYQVRIV